MIVQADRQCSVKDVIDINKFSSSEKLFGVTACVMRFLRNASAGVKRVDRQSGALSVAEIIEAEKIWIKEAQAELKTEKKFTQLSVSLRLKEEEGILRSQADTFLCCLRRFAARRGAPSLIVSDNAKTFKAAEKALRKICNEPKVRSELGAKRITWRFNLERAPWWGGFFERMVRSVKRCLRKVLGNAKLNLDELSTVLVEVEGTLNARPLTENEVVIGASSCGERFKYVTLKLQHFWKRWKGEYLTGLREFHKCTNGGKLRKVQKGDVVTVFGEGEKRCTWKLAVVEELIVGKDKEVRGAKVRLAGKGKPRFLNRPIEKLFPLEVQSRPGGEREERDIPTAKPEGDQHERTRRAAAIISKAKTKAMLDS
ncbi:uncharacterized protein LOC114536759 [Dendronephthya gigantea]|uniref:uncharacterized protein LOC114536759 n=1 Tax=Dendronephthya gigantea TaxID=151771 RepID=UPI00106D330A|nr:uncharacterized protein LOC114536759 [Dendronephthya gigantea]